MPGIPYQSPYPQGIPSASTPDDAERQKFYGSRRWGDLSKLFRKKNPLCAKCTREGRTALSELVHHIQDRIDHPELAYKWSNLEALCRSCHSSHHKTGANRRRGDRR